MVNSIKGRALVGYADISKMYMADFSGQVLDALCF
jgi:hypothetical protein